MQRGRAHGFTLIEMLVIIAVTAILIAILMPVFCHPRGCYRSCISNLKKLGVAAAMYAQDYDDTLFWNPAPGGLSSSHWSPTARPGDCAPQPRTSFVALLEPCVSHPIVFWCPQYEGYDLSRHLAYRGSLIRSADGPTWVKKIGYGFNEVLVGSPCRPRTVDSLKSRPAEVALLADATEPWASGSGVWVREGRWRRYWELKPGETPRHGTEQERGQNFVFVDGHAKFLRPLVTESEDGRGY
jgi:prepilin-type processing-associated H-X9-DG protein